MIRAEDAVSTGRALLGTPYSQLDCINFIKKIIRTAPGGVPGYTTAGTNTLWKSAAASGKYRDLTWTQEGVSGAQAGMLAFKRSGSDVHHVGLCTGEGTVLHSSSANGGQGVVETDLDNGQWTLLAIHRYIQVAEPADEGDKEEESGRAVLYRAIVHASPNLRIRERAVDGKIIGHIPDGETVDVLSGGLWPRVRYGDALGYVSGEYLETVEDGFEETNQDGSPERERLGDILILAERDAAQEDKVVIVDEAGNRFDPLGSVWIYAGKVFLGINSMGATDNDGGEGGND